MDLHDRLRFARLKAGYATAAEAARRLGVPYGTYSGHENGSRGIKGSEISRYAKAFNVPHVWLAVGDLETKSSFLIEKVGTAGLLPDGEISIGLSTQREQKFLISPFLDIDSGFIETEGFALRGIAEKDSIIIFSKKFTVPDLSHIGHLCICELSDGRFFIRNLQTASDDGRFDLEAPIFSPMKDIIVKSVSAIYLIATKFAVNVLKKRSKNIENFINDIANTPEFAFPETVDFPPRSSTPREE